MAEEVKNVIVQTGDLELDTTKAIVDGKVVDIDPKEATATPTPVETKEDKKVNKILEKALRDEKNIFDTVIGEGYGARLAQVTNANITDRFWLMGSVVSYADQDPQLNDRKKKLVKDLEDAFFDACCVNGPSKRLNNLISNRPNLVKMVKPNRVNRVYDTIDMISHRLGFDTMPNGIYLPVFFSAMSVCYGWKSLEQAIAYQLTRGEANYVGSLLTALLAKYANGLSPTDYVNMWFVLMFAKNLSVCSITQKDVLESNPELNEYAENLFQLVDRMIDNCCIEMRNIVIPNNSVPEIAKTAVPKDENDNIVEIEV